MHSGDSNPRVQSSGPTEKNKILRGFNSNTKFLYLLKVTPTSLRGALQLEAAYPVLPYWEKQAERCDNGKFTALGATFDSISDAENSVKQKRQILIKWLCEVNQSYK